MILRNKEIKRFRESLQYWNKRDLATQMLSDLRFWKQLIEERIK